MCHATLPQRMLLIVAIAGLALSAAVLGGSFKRDGAPLTPRVGQAV